MIISDIVSGFEFIYTQPLPSATWVITHNLNCYPSVTVIDSGNSQVEGDETFKVVLSNPVSCLLEIEEVESTVINDDTGV